MDNTKLDLHDIKKMIPEEMYQRIIRQAWMGDPDWLIDLISLIGEPIERLKKSGDTKFWGTFFIFFLNNKPEDFAQELIYHQLKIQANLYNPSPEDIREKQEHEQE